MPMRFICSIHASGYSLACSTSRTVGLTSRSTNARTVSTSMVSSSLNWVLTAHIQMYGHIDTRCASMPAWPAVTLYGQIVGRTLLRRPARRPGVRRGAVDDADRRRGRGAPVDHRRPAAAGARRRTVGTRSTGAPSPLAHPALVCDVAIGQSTLVTQRVKANLFYRGLTFHRFPVLGDTLFTRTEVVGLQAELGQARPCPDRPGGAADDHHRRGRPAGARLLPLRDAAAEQWQPTPGTPTTCRRSAPRRGSGPRPDRRLGRRGVPGPGARRPLRSRAGRHRAAAAPPTSSAARRSWPGCR